MSLNVKGVVERYNSDRTRLMDILWEVQRQEGYISDESVTSLAEALNMSPVDVRETVTFYHFYLDRPFGKHVIHLCDSVIARHGDYDDVLAALEQETGSKIGEVSADGVFGLAETPCIGLSDQEPAMMVDDVVFTRLTSDRVAEIVSGLKAGKSATEIANPECHESGTLAYVQSVVDENIRNKGPVFFQGGIDHKQILKDCLASHPEETVVAVTESGVRGRGGAGFPTGLKWRMAREAEGAEKYIICNADEGEPGTFKDRVLLTRSPKDVLVGMVIAGHAIGSRHGIVYLRSEYWYLKDYIERQIQDLHDNGLLGTNVVGSDFDFDIRVQMGAGAYICGDETALIESCEGKRGTPRVKPPYPIQQGYLGMPTAVNNVETYACVTRIMEKGPQWFSDMGTEESAGTRLLSVSGDCARPGIYEIEWGTTLNEVLELVGAMNPMAVQVSGPSGECASVAQEGNRRLCYGDLGCNGSFMIFDASRDLLDIVRHFMHFFVDESCGICTPCRAGSVDMLTKIDRVIAGKASQHDLDECVSWGALMKGTSRCGLGTTAAKPILTTMNKFSDLYQAKLSKTDETLLASFDMEEVLRDHDDVAQKVKKEASV